MAFSQAFSRFTTFMEDEFRGLPQVEENSRKNSEISKKARNCGNELYKDKHHNKDVHVRNLLFYSKSVAYAPLGSEELAKAYGNRSALLFHLRKYKECIVDVDLALKVTRSSTLSAKLLCRKAECLKMVDPSSVKETLLQAKELINSLGDNEIEAKEKLTLIYSKAVESHPLASIQLERIARNLPEMDGSDEVPEISKKLILKYDEKKKVRNFVAEQDIKTGEILLIEPAFAQTPDLNKIYEACSHCLKLVWNGIPCNSCALAIYCSESCKSEAWDQYHDMECSKIDFVLTPMGQMYFAKWLLVIRTLIKTYKTANTDDFIKYLCDIYKECENHSDPRTRGFGSDGKLRSNDIRALLGSDLVKCYGFEDGGYRVQPIIEKLPDVFFDIFGSKVAMHKDVRKVFYTLAAIFPQQVEGYECTCCAEEGEHISENRNFCIFSRGAMHVSIINMMAHSCHHNVTRNFVKGKTYMVAIRPIKKGEKPSFAWNTTMFESRDLRQLKIKRNFGVTCDCEACTENWNPYSEKSQELSFFAFQSWVDTKAKEINNTDFEQRNKNRPLRHYEGTAELLQSIHEYVDSAYAKYEPMVADVVTFHFKYVCRSWCSPYYEVGLEIPERCG